MNRTVAIIITVVTVFCCACPGFGICIAGIMGLAGVPFTTTINDTSSVAPISTTLAVGLICSALILILIPFVVGFFTFRSSKSAATASQGFDGPVPPTA